MFTSTLILILGFGLLVALSGTFSGSETALFSLNRIELRRFERSGSRRERVVAAIAARPERLLAGILFGNTLVNVAGSSVMLAITRRLEGHLAGWDPVPASVVAATAVILLFGEILPKGIAVHWPTRVAPLLMVALAPLLKVIAPASHLLERVALGFLRGVGVREEKAGTGLGRRELQVLFEDIQAGKGITEDEGEIAANIFDFFETRAYEIMTPRVDLVGVPVALPRNELRERVLAAHHSRLPVYRDSLDQIVGFLNTKEFLLDSSLPLEDLLRPVHFVPERARLHRVLAEVQSRRLNLVVVVNEYGGTAGLITKEDLVETVVGEIFSEHEAEAVLPLERAGEDVWRVDGLYPLEDLAEEMNVPRPEGPAQTVAGHLAHLLGRPPRPGDTAEDGPLRYQVLQIRRHRAHRVQVTLRRPEPGEGAS